MADPARPLTEVEREARFLTGGGVTGVQVVGEKGWHVSQTLEIWLYYYVVVEIECLDICLLS